MNLRSDIHTDTRKGGYSILYLQTAKEVELDQRMNERVLWLMAILAKDDALSEKSRAAMIDVLYGHTVSTAKAIREKL